MDTGRAGVCFRRARRSGCDPAVGIPAASHLRCILLERVISIIESAALEQHRAVCVYLI